MRVQVAVGLRGTRYIQLLQVEDGDLQGIRSVGEPQLQYPLHCAASVPLQAGNVDMISLAVGFENDGSGVVALFCFDATATLKNPVSYSALSI